MARRWEDMEAFLKDAATEDVRADGEIGPALGAFATEQPRLLAWLRPFPKGGYADPMIELLALAMPLDANRLMLSIGGRVWSLEEPIPPVSADGDLRQQALVLHIVDGARGRPRAWSVVHPFDLDDGEPQWHDPQRLDGGEGWIFAAMDMAVRQRHKLRADDAEIRRQAERVVRLGHRIYMPEELSNRLDAAPR